MLSFFSLIRVFNLLIILLLLYLLRFAIYFPILKFNNLSLQLTELQFALLSFSFVFIAAAGYIINDVFDYETDSRNPLKRVKIKTKISKSTALKVYYIFNTIGFIFGLIVCFTTQNYWQISIYIFLPIVLWWYSAHLQKKLLLGNLVIALVITLVPMLIAFFEYPLMLRNYEIPPIYYNVIMYWSIAYAVFSFIITLIREIVKDMIDAEYDIPDGYNTLAIRLKPIFIKIILTALMLICIVLLLYVYNNYFNYTNDKITLKYFVGGLIVPMIYFIYLLIYAKNPKDYGWLSGLLKFIMVVGILYTTVANHLINNL